MSDLLQEIRAVIAHSIPRTLVQLKCLPQDMPGWILRETRETVCIFIPIADGIEFNEGFSSVGMWTAHRQVDGTLRNCLHLECENYLEREAFASIGEEFIRPECRDGLVSNPAGWWTKWKDLLGNAFRHQMPHAVLGEMVAYRDLLQNGVTAQWKGPDSASHDIVSAVFDIEVKSTLRRYGSTVAISGQHQLETLAGRSLYLAFIRFEPHSQGVSIETVALELRDLGADETELEDRLIALGYGRGKTARKESFIVNEASVYPVNESFPRVVPASFPGGVLPYGVLRISYEVDLTSLVAVPLKTFLLSQQDWLQV